VVVDASKSRPFIGWPREDLLSERMEVRMKSILDPTFRYTSSANTDLRKTFARIKRESRRQMQTPARDEADTVKKVTPIFRGQRPAA
jgi:hypothetical protein